MAQSPTPGNTGPSEILPPRKTNATPNRQPLNGRVSRTVKCIRLRVANKCPSVRLVLVSHLNPLLTATPTRIPLTDSLHPPPCNLATLEPLNLEPPDFRFQVFYPSSFPVPPLCHPEPVEGSHALPCAEFPPVSLHCLRLPRALRGSFVANPPLLDAVTQ